MRPLLAPSAAMIARPALACTEEPGYDGAMTAAAAVRIAMLAVAAALSAPGATWSAPAEEVEAMSRKAADNALGPALAAHVKALSGGIGERSVVRGDGLDRARAYVKDAFERAGLTVSEQVYEYEGRAVANLIADVPGTPRDGSPYIVGAHYDSVVGTPGADDNASGVAVMLELARRAARKPPKAPLRFVAFTLEEPPTHATRHQGSRVFVRSLADAGQRAAGAVVLEMVGLTTPRQGYPLFLSWLGYPEAGNFIGVVGNRHSRAFGEAVIAAMRRNPALPIESLFVWLDGWIIYDTRLSDHAPFWDAGWPALMVTDTAYFRNPHYHGPGDRAETLDYAFMAELVRSLELALDALAEDAADSRP